MAKNNQQDQQDALSDTEPGIDMNVLQALGIRLKASVQMPSLLAEKPELKEVCQTRPIVSCDMGEDALAHKGKATIENFQFRV